MNRQDLRNRFPLHRDADTGRLSRGYVPPPPPKPRRTLAQRLAWCAQALIVTLIVCALGALVAAWYVLLIDSFSRHPFLSR